MMVRVSQIECDNSGRPPSTECLQYHTGDQGTFQVPRKHRNLSNHEIWGAVQCILRGGEWIVFILYSMEILTKCWIVSNNLIEWWDVILSIYVVCVSAHLWTVPRQTMFWKRNNKRFGIAKDPPPLFAPGWAYIPLFFCRMRMPAPLCLGTRTFIVDDFQQVCLRVGTMTDQRSTTPRRARLSLIAHKTLPKTERTWGGGYFWPL